MRKITVLGIILLGIALYLLPATSKATITLSALTPAIEDEMHFKPSRDVTIEYGVNSGNLAYGAYDWHSKGTKGYATGSGESKFYYDNCTGSCGSSGPTAPTINDNGTVSGWSEE